MEPTKEELAACKHDWLFNEYQGHDFSVRCRHCREQREEMPKEETVAEARVHTNNLQRREYAKAALSGLIAEGTNSNEQCVLMSWIIGEQMLREQHRRESTEKVSLGDSRCKNRANAGNLGSLGAFDARLTPCDGQTGPDAPQRR